MLTIELAVSFWAAAVGLPPGFPPLTPVSLPLWGHCGFNYGGQLWTAIYRAAERDSIVSALMSISNAPDHMDILAALLRRCLGDVPPLGGLVTWGAGAGVSASSQ